MTTVAYFTAVFAATLWLSRFLLRFMKPERFMDEPEARKIHDTPKPRFGGIAFGVAIIVIGWFLLNDHHQYTWYFLGAMGVFAIGAIDDYWTLSWRYKLPFQLLIGLLIAAKFAGQVVAVDFFGIVLSYNMLLLMGLYLFWFIGILNALNLIDGMDGLAGGYMFLTAFIALVIGWLGGNQEFIYINAIYMGGMAAFLHFNQRPAQFFMGDSGSLLLGYHVATLPLLYFTGERGVSGHIDMTPFLLLASYLIIDTARVFFVRLRRHSHPLEPDQSHLHHMMYLPSKSYNGTLVTIFLILGIFGLFAINVRLAEPGWAVMLVYLAFLALFIFVPGITEYFVRGLNRLLRRMRTSKEEERKNFQVLRVRFLPLLTLVYFAGIFIQGWPQLWDQPALDVMLANLALISLFYFFGSLFPANSEVALIGVGLIQGFALNSGLGIGAQDISPMLYQTSMVLRYLSIGLIASIAIGHYLFYTKYNHQVHWSALDLLVVFILVALAGLQSLGIGIPVMLAFELGVLYFANKLVITRYHLSRVAAGSTVVSESTPA